VTQSIQVLSDHNTILNDARINITTASSNPAPTLPMPAAPPTPMTESTEVKFSDNSKTTIFVESNRLGFQMTRGGVDAVLQEIRGGRIGQHSLMTTPGNVIQNHMNVNIQVLPGVLAPTSGHIATQFLNGLRF
jgi:hypothetical protein